MATDKNRIVWTNPRGRNGADSPIGLAEDEVTEAINVDFADGALCRKRRGTLAITNTSGPVSTTDLVAHLPAASTEATAELFAMSTTGPTIHRFRPSAGIYAWTTPTIADAATSNEPLLEGATLNGKCFLAYKSAVNRLHCWDGSTIRRVGLAAPTAAPTVANTGAGAYAVVARYYRVAWADIPALSVRRSELSAASTVFTPSGAGSAARVTRPTPPGEGETHWLLYASPDDVYSNYRLIQIVVIATTFYDDVTPPSLYDTITGELPQIAGLNVPPPSAKHIITDGNRLIMAGCYETAASTGLTSPRNARVWYTRVLDSSGIGDDESIPNTSAVGVTPAQKNWLDVGENDGGGEVTALAIINGVTFVFKRRHIYRLAPTGDDLQPYRSVLVSSVVGCSHSGTVASGEDRLGEPVLYFANPRGWYRLSINGEVTFISRPIDDVFSGTSIITFGIYHSQRNQLWVNTSAVAGKLAIYDVRREGWTIYQLTSATPYCGVIFPELKNTAGVMEQTGSGFLKPIVAGSSTPIMGDCSTTTADPGGNFQASITSRPYFPAGLGTRFITEDAVLTGAAASGVTISLTVGGDFGATGQSKTATVSLTAAGSETRVVRKIEDSHLGGLSAVTFQLGDASAVSNAWVLDGLNVRVAPQEPL